MKYILTLLALGASANVANAQYYPPLGQPYGMTAPPPSPYSPPVTAAPPVQASPFINQSDRPYYAPPVGRMQGPYGR